MGEHTGQRNAQIIAMKRHQTYNLICQTHAPSSQENISFFNYCIEYEIKSQKY